MSSQQWNSGLCDCCNHCGICCKGMFCTSCLYGENHETLTGEGCCFACCLYYWFGSFACCFASATRGLLRRHYSLREDPCSDCCVHLWCSPCAVCQEARELKARSASPKPQTYVSSQATCCAPPPQQAMPHTYQPYPMAPNNAYPAVPMQQQVPMGVPSPAQYYNAAPGKAPGYPPAY